MILFMNKACNKGPDHQSPDLNPIQSFRVTSELLGHAHLTGRNSIAVLYPPAIL